MDVTIVFCVTLTSYGKALYLHFYYLTICMYVHILSEINYYYYIYRQVSDSIINYLHKEGEEIRIKRGVRQGDTISLKLFTAKISTFASVLIALTKVIVLTILALNWMLI